MQFKVMEGKGEDLVPAPLHRRLRRRRTHSGLTPAVLLDMGIPGLAVTRALGLRGVPVLALDTKPRHWSHGSRYLDVLSGAGFRRPEVLMRALAEIAAIVDGEIVLVPLHDDYVRFVSVHRERLATMGYRFVMPQAPVIETLIDKRRLHEFCRGHGIRVPVTEFPGNQEELEQILAKMRYPCILKPAESRSWQSAEANELMGGAKAVRANDATALREVYRNASRIDPRVVIQELVEGPDSNLVYVVSYVTANDGPAGFFVGRKLRTYPPHLGRGSYVESVHDSEAASMAAHFVREIDYKGNVGIEFKRDQADGRLHLIEVNARFGLWDGFAAQCGIDVVGAMYDDALGHAVEVEADYAPHRHWINPEAELMGYRHYRRSEGLGFRRWLYQMATARHSAVTNLRDPRPALRFWGGVAHHYLGRIAVRLMRSH